MKNGIRHSSTAATCQFERTPDRQFRQRRSLRTFDPEQRCRRIRCRRNAHGGAQTDRSDELLETQEDTARDKAKVRAEKLHKEGKLDESVVMKAVDLSDTHFTRYAMSHMSGLPSEIVAKMLGSGSGKAVTSLCWKSGMSMRAAINHSAVAKIPPNSLLLHVAAMNSR